MAYVQKTKTEDETQLVLFVVSDEADEGILTLVNHVLILEHLLLDQFLNFWKVVSCLHVVLARPIFYLNFFILQEVNVWFFGLI